VNLVAQFCAQDAHAKFGFFRYHAMRAPDQSPFIELALQKTLAAQILNQPGGKNDVEKGFLKRMIVDFAIY
jgi:hypothetical protein